MYKSYIREDYIKHFKMPEDYQVAGFLSIGAWKVEKYLDLIKGLGYTVNRLSDFFGSIYELKLAGKIYWISILYGGALLSEYAHIACLFGSKNNIHLGSCGGLYPEMNSVDLLMPNYSYGDESSAKMYARENLDHKHFSDKALSKKIADKLSEHKVWSGPIITCQAMLGETLEDVETWSKEGYYGVEMESSTVFAVSNHFGVPAAALVYIGDNLIKGETVRAESYAKAQELRDKAKVDMVKAALDTLLYD